LPRMCVENELASRELRMVAVEEMHMERKVRLVYPAQRQLSHAAQAFLELMGQADA
jgi:DNA-binding transcriptional LysR family regulator